MPSFGTSRRSRSRSVTRGSLPSEACPCGDVSARVALSTEPAVDACRGVSAWVPLATDSKPEVEVLNDFDGYFGDYVSSLLEQKVKLCEAFEVKRIVIDAGPWRSHDVRVERKGDTLFLDFYSACRWRGGPDVDCELLKVL